MIIHVKGTVNKKRSYSVNNYEYCVSFEVVVLIGIYIHYIFLPQISFKILEKNAVLCCLGVGGPSTNFRVATKPQDFL